MRDPDPSDSASFLLRDIQLQNQKLPRGRVPGKPIRNRSTFLLVRACAIRLSTV